VVGKCLRRHEGRAGNRATQETSIRQSRDTARRRPSSRCVDQRGVLLSRELGYAVGRRPCSPKELADRLSCAGEQTPGAVALVTERASAAPPSSLLRWTRTTRLAARGGRLHRPGDPRAGASDADVTGRATASGESECSSARGNQRPDRTNPGRALARSLPSQRRRRARYAFATRAVTTPAAAKAVIRRRAPGSPTPALPSSGVSRSRRRLPAERGKHASEPRLVRSLCRNLLARGGLTERRTLGICSVARGSERTLGLSTDIAQSRGGLPGPDQRGPADGFDGGRGFTPIGLPLATREPEPSPRPPLP